MNQIGMNQIGKLPEFSVKHDFLEKMDLKSLLYPLWINKWLIAIITALCLLLGAVYSHFKIPLYSSNILLHLEDHDNLLAFDKISSASALLGSRGSSAAEVQTALIKSRYILEPVVRQLNLDLEIKPAYFPLIGEWYARNHDALEKPWWGMSHFAWGNEKLAISKFVIPVSEEKKRFTLVALSDNHYALYNAEHQLILKGEVGKEIKVNRQPNQQYIVQINSIDASPKTRFYILKKSTQQIIDQLSERLQINDLSREMQLRVDTGILKVSLVGSNPNNIIAILNTLSQTVIEKNAEKKLKETTKTLAFLNQQIPIVKQSLNQAETALNQYLAKAGILDLTSESRLLLALMTENYKNLNLLRMNKRAALQKYTHLHPIVIALEEKEKSLEAELKSLQVKMSQLPARDQVVVGLMREVRVKNQLYLALLNKIQSLQVVKGGTVSDVNLLGVATRPDGALPKGTISILSFSLLIGLIFGSAIIYLQRLWNSKISDPAIIENKFGLTNIAIIPYSDKQHQHINSRDVKARPLSLLAQQDSKDLSIEALRNLRTSAQFILMDSPNNIITITGVAPGVGKSFVSANFAYLQADTGKKVLLIDGDIRKGHLKDYFTPSHYGLSEVICGSVTLEDALVSATLPNLHFLATGAYPPNPSELLMSHRFKELLDRVSPLYDLIIIDTAPILAVTDAAIIARHAGANFLVLASNTHQAEEIDLALKRFHTNGVNINGVVFNFSKQQKALYRQASTYQYQYEYK